jgi:hypothetical protein
MAVTGTHRSIRIGFKGHGSSLGPAGKAVEARFALTLTLANRPGASPLSPAALRELGEPPPLNCSARFMVAMAACIERASSVSRTKCRVVGNLPSMPSSTIESAFNGAGGFARSSVLRQERIDESRARISAALDALRWQAPPEPSDNLTDNERKQNGCCLGSGCRGES